MTKYEGLLYSLIHQRVFDIYREGIRTSDPPPMPAETLKAAKRAVFEKFLLKKANQNPLLQKGINEAAYELLMDRLWRDMESNADRVSRECTPEELFNEICRKNELK